MMTGYMNRTKAYAGMSDICNISENVNKIDNARLIRKTNALMEVVG